MIECQSAWDLTRENQLLKKIKKSYLKKAQVHITDMSRVQQRGRAPVERGERQLHQTLLQVTEVMNVKNR